MIDLFGNETSGADFSNCGNYRYTLWRIWDESRPLVMCIGLNPSKATGEKPDPTITNLKKALIALGYGGFYMMNCWPYITSDPKLLKHNPMSDEWNDNMITVTASKCRDIIFAWGTFPIVKEKGRDKELAEMFPNAKCFGFNKNGTPRHPLSLMYQGDVSTPVLIPYQKPTNS